MNNVFCNFFDSLVCFAINKFKGLGKGLSALMGDIPQENAQTKNSSEKIPIHFVYANPSQPRKKR